MDGRAMGSRVLRGGSWANNNPDNLRGSNRNRNNPDNRNQNIGFRLCLSAELYSLCISGRSLPLMGCRVIC